MFTTFGTITQPFIKVSLLKNKTRVLALILFYDIIAEKIAYGVLSCVVYSIIKKLCLHWLSSLSIKKLSEITVDSRRGSKYGDNFFTEYWVLEFQIC